MLHIYNMFQGSLTIIVEIGNSTSWVLAEMNGGATDTWKKFSFQVNIKQAFSLLLEAVSGPMPGHVAIDNIRLINCYPGNHASNVCSPHNFHCNDGVCLQSYQLCDLKRDCQDGEDEEQECDKIPPTGRCDFENGLCGWHNNSNLGGLFFETLSGKAPNDRTGPSYDHTYENETGVYAFVNVARAQMADSAKLRSAIYNPPPPCHSNTSAKSCVNTCAIQFYFYKSGIHSGVLALYLYEEEPKHKETHKTKLVWLYGEHDDRWLWFRTILPPVTHQYYLQFEVSRGISIKGDVAIDDISLSRECFGIGIPKEELGNYNYSSYKYYTLTSCGLEGREGPKQKDCDLEYQKTPQTKVKVLSEPPLAGAQLWKVPEDGTYTFIVKGASGGRGSTYDVGHSYGAVVRGVMELSKGQKIFALVGKKGSNACKKHVSSGETSSCVPPLSTRKVEGDKIRELQKLETLTGGGGGGGATYVFTTNEKGHPVPLIVAAGGGGLANVILTEKTHQYGHGLRLSSLPYSGIEYGNNSAGGGGGWARNLNSTRREVSGMSFLKGALGGKACYYSTDGKGDGGFGGGGGGCSAGGGGGGYIGGSAWNNSQDNGEGGYSYASANVKMREFEDDVNFGSGSVIIIPAVEGCGCDYLCVALDEYRHIVQCICPNGWFIDRDNVTCISTPPVLISHLPTWAYIVGGVSISICGFLFALGTVWIYNRLQRRKMDGVRKRMMDGPELQLNRLREASNNMLSEINPNYEFGGVNYSVRDLPQVPRDHLRLVKALGQGAFGEVYQGFYRHRVGDAVEMPVAVKTLPELSTTQAENDFVMEALIMHKFNHPNIVHFIGVCFDKHPRFIVLELLAGGDLKSFLRESRPKPEKPSALTMKDLILCAIDLAKGCKYLEGARFIHRDIAARNCLLTTKGPGRVVKIADFGMARDIYRSDYYRKGGKTMLPIKWMPPEAFMDGVFTAKTDVWSFGVVLWEIMSLGYMPYTGCANRDVMTWVSSGGRLEAPNNCPTQIYAIMRMCWEHEPANRPCFSTIQDRLTYCLQDPEVLNNPLPVFHKAPSAEKDITIMRLPENGDSSCLHVQRASDYLVPVPPPVVTPDITSSPSASSVDKLLANPIVWESSNCVLPVAHSPKPLMNHHESNHIGEISKISISDGNIVQIDKISIPDGKIVHSEKTTPNSVPKNKNNNNNNPHGNIGSNLPLDPANLVKPPLQYVSVGISPTCSAQVPSELQTQLADGLSFTIDEAANRRLPSETEISC